ncbi:2TM domain-containing protein [Priestia megaterium]|nr:2TM domain-containing protein [Priestia megaterium]
MRQPEITYQEAKEKVEKIRGFYIHLTVYVLVNTMLCIINFLTVPQFLWFFFPLCGWGIGITAHAIATFASNKRFGQRWEEKKIKKYMERN